MSIYHSLLLFRGLLKKIVTYSFSKLMSACLLACFVSFSMSVTMIVRLFQCRGAFLVVLWWKWRSVLHFSSLWSFIYYPLSLYLSHSLSLFHSLSLSIYLSLSLSLSLTLSFPLPVPLCVSLSLSLCLTGGWRGEYFRWFWIWRIWHRWSTVCLVKFFDSLERLF